MKACTRCGAKHTDVEETLGRHLSCTEVKEYWAEIRKTHIETWGHPARIVKDEDDNYICAQCRRKL